MPLKNLDASVARLSKLGPAPTTGLVLGSGQGGVVDQMTVRSRVKYGDLGFPGTSVAGHAGELAVGALEGAEVATLSGRIHAYEGRPMSDVVHAVRSLARWGVKRVVLTCSVGAVDPSLRPGDIVLVNDHINFMGRNPLIGPEAEALGERFVDMGQVHDPSLRADARAAAEMLGLPVRDGVLGVMLGPSYETPAEIRMLHTVGAHIVGMSSVPEALALAQLGVPTLVLALVTNLAAGLSETPLDHHEVLEVAAQGGARMGQLIAATVSRWA